MLADIADIAIESRYLFCIHVPRFSVPRLNDKVGLY
jgi:hypothetical protein